MSVLFPASPPKNKSQLFERMLSIIRNGWYEIPEIKRYKGSGGPGNFLEDLLGINAGNQDIADSVGWEVKYYTDKTNLVTLFHKEARPEKIMRAMVREYGWKDEEGRLSFRHTISGRSDRFKVECESGLITVKPLKGNGSAPYWTEDDILNVAGSKLRRLLLVRGERDGQKVRFLMADCFENLHITLFVFEISKGTVSIDFDVREMKPGSTGLRNHGTKFRTQPNNICRLYIKKERLA